MNTTINAKQLRSSLPKVVAQVRKGARFTVLYRSRPAFQVVPVGVSSAPLALLESEPIYRAEPVGRSTDGRSSTDHDRVLYGR